MSRNSRSRRTETEILDAAWDLIAERGAEISVAEIAKNAGVSRQAVYLHFNSRGGLLMQLVKRADDRLAIKEQFFEALDHPDPATRFDLALTAWFNFVPKIITVARDLVRLRATDQEAAAAWEDRMSDLRSWLRTLMTSIKNDDALKAPWTPSDAADYVWAITSVQVWDLLVTDRRWPKRKTASVIKDALHGTLLKQKRVG